MLSNLNLSNSGQLFSSKGIANLNNSHFNVADGKFFFLSTFLRHRGLCAYTAIWKPSQVVPAFGIPARLPKLELIIRGDVRKKKQNLF